jgi:hypothetical protein
MHGSWGTPDPMVNMVVAVVPSPFPEVNSVGGHRVCLSFVLLPVVLVSLGLSLTCFPV